MMTGTFYITTTQVFFLSEATDGRHLMDDFFVVSFRKKRERRESKSDSEDINDVVTTIYRYN